VPLRERLADAFGRYDAKELADLETVEIKKAKYDASAADIHFSGSIEVRVKGTDFALVAKIEGDVYLATAYGPGDNEIAWEWTIGPNLALVDVVEITLPPQRVEIPGGGSLSWSGGTHVFHPDTTRVASPK
jgi:hypothetical protein